MPVTWSDEKLILLYCTRQGIELTTFRKPERQHYQGVLRPNHSATSHKRAVMKKTDESQRTRPSATTQNKYADICKTKTTTAGEDIRKHKLDEI